MGKPIGPVEYCYLRAIRLVVNSDSGVAVSGTSGRYLTYLVGYFDVLDNNHKRIPSVEETITESYALLVTGEQQQVADYAPLVSDGITALVKAAKKKWADFPPGNAPP